jgi:isopentenyl-diphosphate delta-isomerase
VRDEPLTTSGPAASATALRKMAHIDACLECPVEFQQRTTGLEDLELRYAALPEHDLDSIDLSTTFLGKTLAAPVLIGAMTGGTRLSGRINEHVAVAAQVLGIGLMLGSQRVMLEDAARRPSFEVRGHAPDVLLLGNLGVAQAAVEAVRTAVEAIGADGLALHANPLQEAIQLGGDTDFRFVLDRLAEVTREVPFPIVLKEVGHGIGAEVAEAAVVAGVAAIDVAGAGGTSWARVEEFVRWGEIRHPALAEWGIPTAEAVRSVRDRLPATPLVASGGIRTGVDAAKALALGADVVAIALPLLRPAIESADAVIAWLEDFVWELRRAVYCSGCGSVAELPRALRARR